MRFIIIVLLLGNIVNGSNYYYLLSLELNQNGSITITNTSVEEGYYQNQNVGNNEPSYSLKIETADKKLKLYQKKFLPPSFIGLTEIFNDNGSIESSISELKKTVNFVLTIPIYREGTVEIYNELDELVLPLNLTEMYDLYESKLDEAKTQEITKFQEDLLRQQAYLQKEMDNKKVVRIELPKEPLSGSIASAAINNIWFIVLGLAIVVAIVLLWVFVPKNLLKK